MPDTLTLARVVSLYKKGDPEIQENYRPISLLNTFYKIIAAAIQRRLAKTLDSKLMNTQYGFRKDRSTKDALFVGKRMMEYAERLLADSGCPKINLQIRAGNVATIDFYRTIGYEVDDVVSLGKRLVPDD